MRDLAIAYGNNRQAKKWVNKTIKYVDLKERLKVTIRTTESAEEYAKMSKAQRDAAKDHGGFVGGGLAGGRRKVDTIESRSMIALDGDRIDVAFLDNYERNAPYTSFLYTTHSHTAGNPRVRLIFPLTRDITSEEFVAVSRYLEQMLGIDYFDECSYQPNPLMSYRRTRSGRIQQDCQHPPVKAKQTRFYSRKCRTPSRRMGWSVYSIGSSSLFQKPWILFFRMSMSQLTTRTAIT